jgi:hypothetical protein
MHTVGHLLQTEKKGVTAMANASMGNRLHDFPVSHPKQCISMAFAFRSWMDDTLHNPLAYGEVADTYPANRKGQEPANRNLALWAEHFKYLR